MSLGTTTIINSHERSIGCTAAYYVRDLGEFLQVNGEESTQWDDFEMFSCLFDQHFFVNLFSRLYLIISPSLVALLTFQLLPGTEPKWFVVWEASWRFLILSVIGIIYTRNYRRALKAWSSRKLP